MQEMQSRWRAREEGMKGLNKEREAYGTTNFRNWMEEDDAKRKQVQMDIDEYSVRLNEDYRNRTADQERSRVHVDASLACVGLSACGHEPRGNGHSPEVAVRRRDARIPDPLHAVRGKEAKESGSQGGFRITVDSETGIKFSAPRDRGSLDLSDLPAFAPPSLSLGEAAAPVVLDAGVLVLSTLLAFAGAFVAFLRYDIR